MTLQQPGPGESFATELTLVVEVVGEDVHGEGRHADVHLVADVALLSVVGVQAPVGLSVPGEVTAGGVVLPTVGTRVLRLLTLLAPLLAPPVSHRQPVLPLPPLPCLLLPLPHLPELPALLEGLGGRLPRVGDGRSEGDVVAHGGVVVLVAGDVDEGGVVLLSLRTGRRGRSTVRTVPHCRDWAGTGEGREGPAELQQVVGRLGLLLRPVLGGGGAEV